VTLRKEHGVTTATVPENTMRMTTITTLRHRPSTVRIGLSLLALLFAQRIPAAEVVIPDVVAHSIGIGGVLWGTEVRVTNLTGAPHSLTVKDWIGTPGWTPSTISVPAYSTVSVGGWDVFAPNLASSIQDHSFGAVFGAAVLDVDDGLVVQSIVLAGPNPPIPPGPADGGTLKCPGWLGGYYYNPKYSGNCNTGSGPIADVVSGFFTATDQVDLLWLSTDDVRRTNVTFVNPDTTDATISVHFTAADGVTTADVGVFVPARGIAQLTDVFRNAAAAVKAANHAANASAARAHITSSTRFYALAFVISNDNNTAGISLPRLSP
jgi:hypothetical protein